MRSGLSLDEFLAYHRVDLDILLRHVRSSFAGPVDCCFVGGSAAEGLANSTSDLDLYIVTDRTDATSTPLIGGSKILIGSLAVEINVLRNSELARLIDRFDTWIGSSATPQDAMSFHWLERVLLHRLRNSVPLFGHEQIQTLQKRVSDVGLSRLKLNRARHDANSYSNDLLGLKRCGDSASAVPVAQELLAQAVDALIATAGLTNASWKWRMSLLAQVPNELASELTGERITSVVQWYQDLHRAPARPQNDEWAFTDRIVRVARRILALAEWRIIGRGDRWPDLSPTEPSINPLPQLAYDTIVQFCDDRFQLFRFTQRDELFSLTPEMFSILLCFDGVSGRDDAIRRATTLLGENIAEAIVDDLTALIRATPFTDTAQIDQAALDRILAVS